jgi:hypothetical protein
MAAYKNIILVALRDFVFSHGLGPGRVKTRLRIPKPLSTNSD